MDNAPVLEQRRRSVVRMTALSLVCYLGFLVTSTVSALQALPLEHAVTLASLALVFGAFLLLPRSYLPTQVTRIEPTPAEERPLRELARLQRNGLFIRVGYLVGALVTVLFLPMILRET